MHPRCVPGRSATTAIASASGGFHASRFAFEQLKQTKGCLIYVSAPQATVPQAYQAHVGAAKAGIDIMLKNLAIEWGKHGIRASPTLNSDICDHHPQIVRAAIELGWEILGHNQTNSVWLDAVGPDEERQTIARTLSRIAEMTGKKPAGWLGAGLAETWHTLDYLAEEGCLYVADWVNDDQPYLMDIGGKRLVSIPYSYEINDSPFLYYRNGTIDEFEKMIRRQFDILYAEGEQSGRVMAICLHPYLIGVPHRIAGLDEAIGYIAAHDGVWFATGSEIVNAWLNSGATF